MYFDAHVHWCKACDRPCVKDGPRWVHRTTGSAYCVGQEGHSWADCNRANVCLDPGYHNRMPRQRW